MHLPLTMSLKCKSFILLFLLLSGVNSLGANKCESLFDTTGFLTDGSIVVGQMIRQGQATVRHGTVDGVHVIIKKYASIEEVQKFLNPTQILKHAVGVREQINNEMIAYMISVKLRLNNFPEGYVKEIDGEPYWIQLFIPERIKIRGASKEQVDSMIEQLRLGKWGLRDQILAYLLGDMDHSGSQNIINLDEGKIYYIDAGAAFTLASHFPGKLIAEDLKNVYPFKFRHKVLNKSHIKEDPELFDYIAKENMEDILSEISPLISNPKHLEDLRLRLLKLQRQVRVILNLPINAMRSDQERD